MGTMVSPSPICKHYGVQSSDNLFLITQVLLSTAAAFNGEVSGFLRVVFFLLATRFEAANSSNCYL